MCREMDGFEIATSWQPASGVGGDCFDAIGFGPHRLALSIADVVGKGIPAALLMSNLQASVRAFATDAAQPQELCQQVNRILCGHIAEGRFISFFYCVADADLGTLTYANAGHYPPVAGAGRRDRRAPRRRRRRCWASSPEGSYEQGSVSLGTRRSAGAVHRRHHRSARRARRRVRRRAAGRRWPSEHRTCSAPALQARLVDAVAAFTGGRFQDDATLIVLASAKTTGKWARSKQDGRRRCSCEASVHLGTNCVGSDER